MTKNILLLLRLKLHLITEIRCPYIETICTRIRFLFIRIRRNKFILIVVSINSYPTRSAIKKDKYLLVASCHIFQLFRIWQGCILCYSSFNSRQLSYISRTIIRCVSWWSDLDLMVTIICVHCHKYFLVSWTFESVHWTGSCHRRGPYHIKNIKITIRLLL